MEEKLALLIADLSGYTALTETHGAGSAADIVDKYLQIVEKSLADPCRLVERRGDEVMITAPCADSLLLTALMILKHAAAEDRFLQVHGGLHAGTVLRRHHSYFGSALNLTARIAADAAPGTFLCSDEFISALKDPSVCRFHPKGAFRFKNVSAEIQLAEITAGDGSFLAVDPVCRMLIREPSGAVQHPADEQLYFCSTACLQLYEKNRKAPDTERLPR